MRVRSRLAIELGFYSSMMRAVIFPGLSSSRPTLTGNEKRRGPALPGLKYKTPFFHSCLGAWLCP